MIAGCIANRKRPLAIACGLALVRRLLRRFLLAEDVILAGPAGAVVDFLAHRLDPLVHFFQAFGAFLAVGIGAGVANDQLAFGCQHEGGDGGLVADLLLLAILVAVEEVGPAAVEIHEE